MSESVNQSTSATSTGWERTPWHVFLCLPIAASALIVSVKLFFVRGIKWAACQRRGMRLNGWLRRDGPKAELKKALALKSQIRRAGVVQLRWNSVKSDWELGVG